MHRLVLVAFLVVLALPLGAADVHVRVDPAVKTGIDGTTEFSTIQNALDHHPFATPNADGSPGRVFIEIVPGTYHERLFITQNHPNVALIGLGKSPSDVVITNSLNASQAGGTYVTATVQIESPGFEADNLTIENTAGNTGQAVAVANRSDRSVFKHCRLLGYQDTLFADFGRQYYVDSFIEGAVDYIFGNAAAVFERDELHSIGSGYITAHSRTSADQPTGYVILNSRVTATLDPAAHQSITLGRPWRPFARVIFIHTDLPAELNPAGWSKWRPTDPTPTAYFAESDSTGPGASPTTRVPWSHQLTAAEAAQFLPAPFLAGSDHWNPGTEAVKLP
jgi:pectinesterase